MIRNYALISFTFVVAAVTQIPAQSIFGFEVSYAGMSPGVSVPGVLAPYYGEVTAGAADQLYAGVTMQANALTQWTVGYNAWRIPLYTQLTGSGTISYKGLYVRYARTWRNFYVGGGLDASFEVEPSFNTNHPLLQNFYNQVNLVFETGPKVSFGKFCIKVWVGASVQFSSINDSGTSLPLIYLYTGQPAPPDNDVNLQFYQAFRSGVGLQYNLYNFHK